MLQDNFHRHIGTQQGRLPQKPSQVYQSVHFRKTLYLRAIFVAENGFRRML